MVVRYQGAVLENQHLLRRLVEVEVGTLQSFPNRFMLLGLQCSSFSAEEFSPNPTSYASAVRVHFLSKSFRQYFFGIRETEPPESTLAISAFEEDASDVAVARNVKYPELRSVSVLYRFLMTAKAPALSERHARVLLPGCSASIAKHHLSRRDRKPWMEYQCVFFSSPD